MFFSWDDKKCEENWRLRKVDFAQAIGIFDDPEIIESIDVGRTMGKSESRLSDRSKASSILLSTPGAKRRAISSPLGK